MSIQRVTCPVCRREVALHGCGEFRCHGPQHDRCHGSRRTPEQAARYCISNLTAEQVAMMRECWRIGDVRLVELEFGITYAQPRHFYEYVHPRRDNTAEEELAVMVREARHWITALAERAKADKRVP